MNQFLTEYCIKLGRQESVFNALAKLILMLCRMSVDAKCYFMIDRLSYIIFQASFYIRVHSGY